MKKEFSTAWNSSKQPRKQRKYLANAPLHLKGKLMSVNLSKDLRKKLGRRNIEVRKGDKVKIMRGKYKNKTGKVERVSIKYTAIYVEGIQVKKQDGSKASVKLRPSNLQIIEVNSDDKKRMKKQKTETKEVKKVESKEKTKEKKE